jgi:DNA-binding transcriptional ArsR family regulator
VPGLSDLVVGRRPGVGEGTDADVGPVLAALADATRRDLFDRLAERGPDTATNLAVGLPVTRQAVVKHLQVLADAGLVSAERAGREVRYRAEPAGLDKALAWMVAAGAAWDRRLDRLRRRVEGN